MMIDSKSKSLHTALRNEVEKLKVWNCSLMINMESDPEEPADMIDICSELRKYGKLVLPERFHGIASYEAIKKELRLAAISSGFNLTFQSKSEKSMNGSNQFDCYITVSCARSHTKADSSNWKKTKQLKPKATKKKGQSSKFKKRKFSTGNLQPKKTKKYSAGKVKQDNQVKKKHSMSQIRKNTSKRAINKTDTCPFKMNLRMYSMEYKSVLAGRWDIVISSSLQPTFGKHEGHICCNSSLLTVSMDCMDEDEKELALQCSGLHHTSSSISKFVISSIDYRERRFLTKQ